MEKAQQSHQINQMIEKVAQTDARVLITGPNGTGKELVAHQLHEKSERADAPINRSELRSNTIRINRK